MKILVTGGAGYIGSHTVVELLNNNYEIVVVDNLSNSKYEVIRRIERITGKQVKFYKIDVCDYEGMKEVFKENSLDGIIHFAGLKSVKESKEQPLDYYKTNIDSALNILRLMSEFGVKNFVFSSSATVYGNPTRLPITEEDKVGDTTNPYGTTKLFIEQILKDLYNANKTLNIAILRYFNPIGAHRTGLIGEDPKGTPNNLVPYVTQVAIGKLDHLEVCGNDYNTPDGTGVRDYIHVCDLAYGHVLALKKLTTNPGLVIYNLGTGKGYSVFDVVNAFNKILDTPIKYEIVPRRAGDVDENYADTTKAYNELGFKAKYDLDDMVKDSWRWQLKNPNGYEEK